ncbi:MAG: SPOR domain-containing protein [Acidithiobacillales bacterium]
MSAPPPDSGGRGGARRILPSVSEVASSLAGVVSASPAALYRVAREVVAEELTRVKQGLESASLETLVERAEQRFRASTREMPPVRQPDLFAGAPPAPPQRPEPTESPMPVLPAIYEAPEEPFPSASSPEPGWGRSGAEVPGPAGSSAPAPPVEPVPADDRPERPRSGAEQTLPVQAADVEMGEEDDDWEEPAPGTGSRPTRRRLWILAVAAFALVAAGIVWILVQVLSPAAGVLRSEVPTKVEVPSPPALPAETAPTAAAPPAEAAPPAVSPLRPAPTAAVPQRAAPARPPAARPALAKPGGRPVAVFTTKDWAGRPPVYVVHFSSHQDRAAAVSAAARLRAELGKPAHAVVVDLGSKGLWYRVVVGEFRTAEEARAFRAALAAKNTPGMGFVYEMKAGR